MTTLKTSEILHLAADSIEGRGWAKGAGWNEGGEGKLCLEGGILAAMGLTNADLKTFDDHGEEVYNGDASYKSFQQCPAYQAVREYLGDKLVPNASLFYWNDAADRTEAEVIEVLRATAMVEHAKEAAAEPALLACPA